jgi:hypothetical protein
MNENRNLNRTIAEVIEFIDDLWFENVEFWRGSEPMTRSEFLATLTPNEIKVYTYFCGYDFR